MPWRIHPDGSYDLITPVGDLIGLTIGCDHRALTGTVQVEDHGDHARIEHDLGGGRQVSISLHHEATGLRIASSLHGFDRAPGWFHPCLGGEPRGFTRWFRQGIGFSGPTGILDLGEPATDWSSESWMLSGLLSARGTLVAGPLAVRQATTKATLRCCVERDNFRNRSVAERRWTYDLGFRLEAVPLDGDLDLPDLHLRWGDDAFATLRAHAAAIAEHNAARVAPPTYHYCSWYHHGEHFTRSHLDAVLSGLDAVDPARRVQTVQIDDGYMTSHGDWLDARPDRWPGGMAPAIAAICASGRRAGLWIAPFMVGSTSRLAAEHPDWLLKDHHGNRIVEWRHYDGSRADHEHYVLDASHPEALAWIATVFRTAHAWGVRFFKTDFMEWGFKDARRVRRHDPRLTGAQAFERAMATIRAAIGPESCWLGCITFFAPSVGWCDVMRVASDVGTRWDGPGGTGNDGTAGGTGNMIEESFATQYLNNVLWQNDPDVCFLRSEHLFLSQAQRDALACWHGILGGSINTSDELHRLDARQSAWWRFLEPAATANTAALPFFGRPHVHRIVVRAYPEYQAWAILVLNEHAAHHCAIVALKDLIGIDTAACFRWEPGTTHAEGQRSDLVCDLPGRTHRLWYVSATGNPPPPSLTLGGIVR